MVYPFNCNEYMTMNKWIAQTILQKTNKLTYLIDGSIALALFLNDSAFAGSPMRS